MLFAIATSRNASFPFHPRTFSVWDRTRRRPPKNACPKAWVVFLQQKDVSDIEESVTVIEENKEEVEDIEDTSITKPKKRRNPL